MDIKNYNRIIIIGSPGSGKSTVALRLGEVTGLPVIHLDKEFWRPGWVETPREEWEEKQNRFVSGERWIIDGNYNGTLEIRFNAAELVIFLDIRRAVCLRSAIKRRSGKKARPDFPANLKEPKFFSKAFFEFLGFIWKFPKQGRKKILQLHKQYNEKPFLHIKSRKKIKEYLKNIS